MKKTVLTKLKEVVNERLETTRKNIEETIESRDEETKSTVGDKYETGRAMVEMEMDKLQEQLDQLLRHKKALSNIKSDSVFDCVDFGSLVETNMGKYFISIAWGALKMDEEKIFCISLISPLGQAIRDKKVGDVISFQGREISILGIQ